MRPWNASRRALATLALFAAGVSGCVVSHIPDVPEPSPAPGGVQATSLLGQPLREFPLPPETRARYERDLATARAAYDSAPNSSDAIIWFGRRLAYLGLLREAIAVYSRGIATHPVNPWFYRHRGHRYITVREFDNAITDLQHAMRLLHRYPDQLEADGQPNARNTPVTTLHSNVRYHLGLAHYLKGEFAPAVTVFKNELAEADNDDRRVSAAYWLYMGLRRLGLEEEAAQVLGRIPQQVDVIENDTYHRLLLFYKGELQEDALLPAGTAPLASVADATVAYGVGNWYLFNGRAPEAEQIFRRIVAGGQWGAFGYIAAEAELARMR